MNTKTLAVLLASVVVAGCSTLPAIIAKAPHRELVDLPGQTQLLAEWTTQADHEVGWADYTGSMEPLIKGWDTLLLERATPQTVYRPGMVVVFDRGDRPAVLHMVYGVKGDELIMIGANCPRTDGWFHRNKVAFVCRRVLALRSTP